MTRHIIYLRIFEPLLLLRAIMMLVNWEVSINFKIRATKLTILYVTCVFQETPNNIVF